MISATTRVLDQLRTYESPNMLAIEADGSWPIVWERARGTQVWDAEGKQYLDLTAAFGVAAAGHANPRVVAAGSRQLSKLPHAMGDVHPHALKAQLARELSRITFERWSSGRHTGKAIFNNSGFESVEAALKTAILATGCKGILAFKGAYHGLGYGALNATHRPFFRDPFRAQLREFGHFVPFPKTAEELKQTRKQIKRLLDTGACGAVLVEPIQARGGINVPPVDFLPMLRECCDRNGALLVLDEIYTGFGRTGKWFACEESETMPDLICLGKALTGGFPLSACVGRSDIIDAAWPLSRGEAIHTSTFQGNPVGCAMALAQITEIHNKKLPDRSARLGVFLFDALREAIPPAQSEVRGRGLMVGVELRNQDGSPATDRAFKAIKEMLRRGFILLPEGEHSNIISLTPPLTITRSELAAAVKTLGEVLS
ncbi:MAG TPA: aspartate aminotransferase family protein [Verrucomicrobiae bacterium]|jgi:4-aminobutyrate aminotransferase-like enzyme|nr:aspartate aminotransferase family protein [Verrucomicrobiae bacterium]